MALIKLNGPIGQLTAPTQPALKDLPLLVRAGLVADDTPVTVWLPGTPAGTPAGPERIHAADDCVDLRRHRTGPRTKATRTAGQVLTKLAWEAPCACHLSPVEHDPDSGDRPFFDAAAEDLIVLQWLHTSDPDRLAADPAVAGDPISLTGMVTVQLTRELPRSPHRALNQLVEDRRTALLALRAELVNTEAYRDAWNRRLVSGAMAWHDARDRSVNTSAVTRALALALGLPVGVERREAYFAIAADGVDRPEMLAEAATRVNRARVWVLAHTRDNPRPNTAFAWAEAVEDVRAAAGFAPVVKIPLAMAFTLNADSLVPVCLDEGYTVQTVRTAWDLSHRKLEEMPAMVRAVHHAGAPER